MSVLVNAALAALAGVIGSLLGAMVAGNKLALPIGILTGLLGYFASGALVPQTSTAAGQQAVTEWEDEASAKKAKKARKAAAEARKKEEAQAAKEADQAEKKAAKKAAEIKAKKAAAKAAAAAAAQAESEEDAAEEEDEESDSPAAPKSKSALKKAKKAAKEAAAKKEAEAAAKAAAAAAKKAGKKVAEVAQTAQAQVAKAGTAVKQTLTAAQEKAAKKAAEAAAAADLEGWETIEATKPTKSQQAKAAQAAAAPQAASGKAKKGESIPASERPLTEDIIIPIAQHKIIVGAGGKTLTMLQEGSGAQIDMPKRDSASSKITITGTPAQVAAAKNAIQSLADRGFSSITHPGTLSDDLTVEPTNVALIIGEKGKYLKAVQDATGTRINLPEKGSTTNKKVTIVGEKEGVKAAKAALRSLLQDGFSTLTHPGWTKAEVEFPSEKFGVLIGPSGNTIKSIQKETSTRINLPEKNSKSNTVSICGLPENVAKVRARFDKMLEPPPPLPDPEEEDLATDSAWGQEHTARGEDALWA